MWFEILPPFLIVTAGIGLPGYGLWWLHKLVNGNHYRRSLLDRWDRAMYQRDNRITGNTYIVAGLETLRDSEEDEDRPAPAPKPAPRKKKK